MSPGLIAALELTLVLGVVLGLAVWELVKLRQDREFSDGEHAPDGEPQDRSPRH